MAKENRWLKRPKVNGKTLDDYPNSQRITRRLAAQLLGCSEVTIANRNYAGLLPFIPSARPIVVKVGDVKRLRGMLANGVRGKLHLGMRIRSDDCPFYSRLEGMYSLTDGPANEVVDLLLEKTDKLYMKYKKEEK